MLLIEHISKSKDSEEGELIIAHSTRTKRQYNFHYTSWITATAIIMLCHVWHGMHLTYISVEIYTNFIMPVAFSTVAPY